MTDEVAALMSKARRSLATPRRIMANGGFDFAVSRAYYAMFYAAEALLASDSVALSKHSAVIAEFNRRYAATGRLDQRHATALRKAFALRNAADYETLPEIGEAQAATVVRDTEALIGAVGELLERP